MRALAWFFVALAIVVSMMVVLGMLGEARPDCRTEEACVLATEDEQ